MRAPREHAERPAAAANARRAATRGSHGRHGPGSAPRPRRPPGRRADPALVGQARGSIAFTTARSRASGRRAPCRAGPARFTGLRRGGMCGPQRIRRPATAARPPRTWKRPGRSGRTQPPPCVSCPSARSPSTTSFRTTSPALIRRARARHRRRAVPNVPGGREGAVPGACRAWWPWWSVDRTEGEHGGGGAGFGTGGAGRRERCGLRRRGPDYTEMVTGTVSLVVEATL